MEEQQEHNQRNKQMYCENFNQYTSKEQAIIYLLWKIHNKKTTVGSLVFYEELENKFKLTKTQWGLVKEFMSGANLVVNQVVIQESVNKGLINRFGVMNE